MLAYLVIVSLTNLDAMAMRLLFDKSNGFGLGAEAKVRSVRTSGAYRQCQEPPRILLHLQPSCRVKYKIHARRTRLLAALPARDAETCVC